MISSQRKYRTTLQGGYMNSRIINKGQKNLKKRLAHLSVCLIAALTLASCSSTNSREIAQEKANDDIYKSDVKKIQEGNQAPHKFHGKRFEKYNEY